MENEEISFLGKEGQTELLARVQYAQQEVTTAQMLLRATEGQVGVRNGSADAVAQIANRMLASVDAVPHGKFPLVCPRWQLPRLPLN